MLSGGRAEAYIVDQASDGIYVHPVIGLVVCEDLRGYEIVGSDDGCHGMVVRLLKFCGSEVNDVRNDGLRILERKFLSAVRLAGSWS